jgi:serine kinase of HPr protein (carbohydrate metabolism regulator)
MKIARIQELLKAELLTGEEYLDHEVWAACCSDMMSDVLAFVKDQGVLLTGLLNSQVIRTANMMDMVCIVIVRNKVPTEEMIELAEEHGLVLMRSPLRAYEASGVLYYAGLGREGADV